MNSPLPNTNGGTQQSQVFGDNVADSTGGPTQTIKELIKELLAPNVQQISYMLDFFETQSKLNESLKELLARQSIKMLLGGSSNKDKDFKSEEEIEAKQKGSQDVEKVLEEQFAQLGQAIQHIIGNVPHAHKWSGVEKRTEPSGYIHKLLEQIKQFEYKVQRFCSTHHISQGQVMTDQLWWLWDMLSADLMEQYSLVTEIDANGRANMLYDVDYLIKLCHSLFKGSQIHPMHLSEPVKRK